MNKELAFIAYPLEEKLSEFESKWSVDSIECIESLLPPEGHPKFGEALTEFVRVDMELRFNAGDPSSTSDYITKIPILNELVDARSLLAFEEFRLRNISGEHVSAEIMASRYDVSMSQWPNVDFENGVTSRAPSIQNRLNKFDRKLLPNIGDAFANFRIIGKLGEGAFGTVMLAQQDDLAGRLCVLKFVPTFSEEHSFLARMQHSNIVPVYSVHGNEHFMAICMPFMGVATLQDLNGNIDQSADSISRLSVQSTALLETTNRLKEKTIESTISDKDDLALFQKRNRLESKTRSEHQISVFRQFAAQTVLSIAEGLAYAHEHGIVHGDLKPANILINDDCEPVLLDFHLSSSKAEGLGSHVGGTLAYMAPEHFDALNNDEQVDARTDIYSAGVILFELVNGYIPFEDSHQKNSLADLKSSRENPPAFSTEEKRLLGHDLTAIAEKCLSPSAANRYQDGTELAHDLKAHLENRRLLHAKDNVLTNRITKWARRNPRLSSASSIATLAGLVLIGISLALFSLKHRLAANEATNSSRQIVEQFEKLRQPLASYVFFDRKHFDQAIENARSAVSDFAWHSVDAHKATERYGLIDEPQRKIESNIAAELHYWIAEGLQRIALEKINPVNEEEQKELLKDAIKHNQIASEFWNGEQPLYGLKLQRDKIETRISSPEYTPDIDLNLITNSSLDKSIAAWQIRMDNLKSRELWNEVIEDDPTKNSLPWICLGQNHYRTGNFETAKACFTVCIGLEPDNAYARLYRAMSVLQIGSEIETARADLLKAKEIEGDDVFILQNLALVYGKTGKFEEAKKCYDRAIELGTTNTRVWYLRSLLNRRLGKKEAADADLDHFVRTQPTDSESFRTRGTHKIASDPESALDDLKKAFEGKPFDWKTLNNIAHLQSEKLNDLDSAIETMSKVIELRPKSAKNWATRGVLYARSGDREKAIADAKKSLRLSESADTLYRVTGIYAQTSKTNKDDADLAYRYLRQAVSKNPQLVIKMKKTDPDIEPLKSSPEMQEIDGILKEIIDIRRK